ncbi:pumilio homolog 12-like [Sesamum indicum]|uniref:Pumilio homolog 12-like n=1 Tax=Sesamum indicum TaxID=4182 RepID=A0A6I9SL47_SESIN|nr:pumilio homolog 12-like [Sesamum indicum]
MERKIPEIPYSPAYQTPENFLNPHYQRFLSAENHPQSPLITDLHSSNQAIESAFSRLTLFPDFGSHGQKPSFISRPATLDAVPEVESVPLPMAFGERQQAVFWAQSQSNNGGVNGPFGFFGAHQDIHVDPDAIGFLGRGPYVNGGDHPLKSMKYPQRQDFYSATCDYNDLSFLHGKEPSSRKGNTLFPVLSSAQKSNFYSSTHLYSNQHLHQWQQQFTLENMRGRIVTLAKDQVWSGMLNLKLEEGVSEEEIEMVLPEVMEFLGDLMRNQFGSHFVQKLFVACNENQRTRIIMALTKFPFKLISICLNSYGARAIQKLLEKLITPQQISLVVWALSPGAIALATDPNGQHVIQYCVKQFPGEYNKHLFNEIANNCFKIATNKSGCCVLQSCVENSLGEVREQLINEIIENAVGLAQDPYGNYVVQHLLGMRIQEVTTDLLKQFKGCFAPLSCNKYASNVVEKFLLESGENNSETIIMELLKSRSAPRLLLDPFGNFVIQSALSASKGHTRDALLKLIQVNERLMQSNLYGKKILATLEKRKLQKA